MRRSKIKFSGRIVVVAAIVLTGMTMALAAIGVGPRFITVTGGDSVTIPVADLHPGDIKFYSYRDAAGSQIRFILERETDGRVQAAVDACQQCAQYRKGYTASGGYLVCRFCGNRYKLDAAPAGAASCSPIRLPVQLQGDSVKVDTSALEQHRGLF
ncbi:MAG: Fe-S-containing protein [Candidatus Binataceae bacterium]